ncbi:MAG: protein kinase [Clostridiales bacterium]|nr:protein kinase [Clostridiales bacterium]
MRRCFSCFKEFTDEFEVCPHCGTVVDYTPVEPIHLLPGSILANRYYIGKAVGSGGFGIIYRAWDYKLETIVAVKEFFVSRIMTRAQGQKEVIVNRKSHQEYEYRKERFLAEARTMAKFGTHRNIPNVFEFFEENSTAYIVMELLEGQTLKEYMIEKGGVVDKEFAIMVTREVGKALTSLHQAGIIHRDVAPDNIYLCSGNELKIKLLDLGAAKLADSTDKVVDIILKPGYSPAEQYENTNNIGPWTDIYALGATLYVMLTGTKPEESTNRKISDTVPYPRELDPTISENLSNAVMKAMAVEKHMRFSSVNDFISAIDKNRKVIPIKKEKKRRFRRRLIGIVAAILILAAGGFLIYKYYQDKRSVQYLDDADITIWYCAESGSDEEVAMQAVIDDFTEVYPNVKIDAECYPESEYYKKLEDAAENGELPTLFESTGVSESVLEEAEDISSILKSDQAKDCHFLEYYEEYYQDKKCVPLGIEVPVAYVITSGYTSMDYSERTFTGLNDFGDAKIAYDDDYIDLVKKNFDKEASAAKAQFMNDTSNECAVMISSSMALNKIKSELTNYEKEYVYFSGKDAVAMFTYEWSIGDGNKSEMAAAKRLLSWMLGNKYQDILMISRCSDGQIPVNSECFNSKTETKDYEPLREIYKDYSF